MEIERKWMVAGWPQLSNEKLPLIGTEYQEQGYVHTQVPIVRIRLEARIEDSSKEAGSGSLTEAVKESVPDGCAHYIMCFKSAGYLMREEIEIEISKEEFDRLSGLIGLPLIRKVRRIYQLPGDLALEVNLVDEGLPTEFMYAEIEYSSELQARSWNPSSCGLGDYLTDDVTEQPGQSMSAFWARTRILSKHAD